ncbi:hypothetical protein FNV43_RR18815 [Rhamnella rubrinervis]|uniref:Uncharacterized protein n=1 Tax=Rhamnella rubrinervis TaxID=2594499 RepID=A0A8K0GWF0_9ROSA|nr:hypothetical protein FNV43_RR18815 [Rhamnella rubrinervis]
MGKTSRRVWNMLNIEGYQISFSSMSKLVQEERLELANKRLGDCAAKMMTAELSNCRPRIDFTTWNQVR